MDITHLSTTANTTIVTPEGNTLVLDHHILQVLVSLADVHAFDGLGGLTGVLMVGDSKTTLNESLPEVNQPPSAL